MSKNEAPSKPPIQDADTLSVTTKTLVVIAAVAVVVRFSRTSALATSLLPLIFTPTVLAFYYHRSLPPSQRSKGSLETLVWMYLITGTVGMVTVVAVQAGLGYLGAYVLFGEKSGWFMREFQNLPRQEGVSETEHKAARAEFAMTPSYWVFLLYMTFILAGLCEEMLKYVAIVAAKRFRGGRLGSDKEYLVYGALAPLSFATIENALFFLVACEAGESGSKLATTVFERSVAGVPGHMLGGISTALGIIRRDERKEHISLFKILRRSILCHGIWDLSLLTVSALDGNLGWVHPTSIYRTAACYVFISALTLVLLGLIRSEMRALRML